VKPVRNNDKENSASKRQPRRQNHKRAHTVGIPVNQGKCAYVLESEGLSVVPYFKKTPMPRDSPRLKWSLNQLTNQPTITRKENYANGRWNETPPKTVLPQPPSHWLTPRRESKPLTPMSSTLKSVQLSSFSSCSVDEDDDDDDDDISVVSGIDNVSSCDFASRLCQDSVYDSGFSQILSEASLSELASFSVDSSNSASECCEVSSKHPPSQSDESESGVEVLESDEGDKLLARILQQVEGSPQSTRKETSSVEEMPISRNIFKNDGIDALGSILASIKCETPSETEASKDDILSNLFSNMKC